MPEARIERDEILGTPRLITTPRGFLTGPDGQGKGVTAETARALPANDPHRAVKGFLNEHAALFGHDASALNSAKITRDFTTPHNGVRTAVWQQELDGIPVFEGLLIGHTTKNGEVVSISSRFVPEPEKAADKGVANRKQLQTNPKTSAAQAIVKAAENLGENLSLDQVQAKGAPVNQSDQLQHFAAAPVLSGDAHARLVWLPMDRATMRLCWEVILTSRARGEMFRVLIDTDSGDAVVRHSLTSYISNATYRVFTSDSPTPFSPSHPTPSSAQPPLAPRTLVVTNAVSTNASPNGWINDGDNETRGNNVDAHLDTNDDDQPDLPRPQGSPARVFDFPMNLNLAPASYSSAAVVQLFYWNNWMHDKLYELGFTEAAGNFQEDNFGRGGLGNDSVRADAQDGGGFNNANFSTPPDGFEGRMQMYIFDGPTPDRDGDLDAEIILHEYTHGLSNRRVGGGVGISTLQSAGMGEGWSDFYALALLSEASDDLNGNWAAGGYVTLNFFGLKENYYFGIRLTYLDISLKSGLAGLSRGQGVPAGFVESDLSAYGPCGPQLAVTLPQNATEGDGTLDGQGHVSVAVAPAADLVVMLSSSDTSEVRVPLATVIPAGQTNAAFNLIIMDDLEQDGTQVGMVTASAAGYLSGSAAMFVRDNETATLTVGLPASVSEKAGTVSGTVSLSSPASSDVVVQLASSNPSELQAPELMLIPAGSGSGTFVATLTDNGRIEASRSVVVTAHVDNWPEASATIQIIDDEPRTLAVKLPAQASEAAGALVRAGSVGIIAPLETNLVVALFSGTERPWGQPLNYKLTTARAVLFGGYSAQIN